MDRQAANRSGLGQGKLSWTELKQRRFLQPLLDRGVVGVTVASWGIVAGGGPACKQGGFPFATAGRAAGEMVENPQRVEWLNPIFTDGVDKVLDRVSQHSGVGLAMSCQHAEHPQGIDRFARWWCFSLGTTAEEIRMPWEHRLVNEIGIRPRRNRIGGQSV
jgi:hypothetical protein